MEWISFFEKQPKHGQQIFYYGECVGVWAGHYEYSPDDPASPHIMICGERDEQVDGVLAKYGLKNLVMKVDRMDAPWWMPHEEGMWRPEKPSQPYPKDYPGEQ